MAIPPVGNIYYGAKTPPQNSQNLTRLLTPTSIYSIFTIVIYCNSDELRTVRAFLSGGSEFAILKAQGSWGEIRHDLKQPRETIRLRAPKLPAFTVTQNFIDRFVEEKAEKGEAQPARCQRPGKNDACLGQCANVHHNNKVTKVRADGAGHRAAGGNRFGTPRTDSSENRAANAHAPFRLHESHLNDSFAKEKSDVFEVLSTYGSRQNFVK